MAVELGPAPPSGAVCGDAITTAITMASISLPEMRKNNYSDKLALGSFGRWR
jgi:TRAP-type C4-dicarboxylate transport system permease large subunit